MEHRRENRRIRGVDLSEIELRGINLSEMEQRGCKLEDFDIGPNRPGYRSPKWEGLSGLSPGNNRGGLGETFELLEATEDGSVNPIQVTQISVSDSVRLSIFGNESRVRNGGTLLSVGLIICGSFNCGFGILASESISFQVWLLEFNSVCECKLEANVVCCWDCCGATVNFSFEKLNWTGMLRGFVSKMRTCGLPFGFFTPLRMILVFVVRRDGWKISILGKNGQFSSENLVFELRIQTLVLFVGIIQCWGLYFEAIDLMGIISWVGNLCFLESMLGLFVVYVEVAFEKRHYVFDSEVVSRVTPFIWMSPPSETMRLGLGLDLIVSTMMSQQLIVSGKWMHWCGLFCLNDLVRKEKLAGKVFLEYLVLVCDWLWGQFVVYLIPLVDRCWLCCE